MVQRHKGEGTRVKPLEYSRPVLLNGTRGKVWRRVWLLQLGGAAPGIEWVEARHAAHCPTLHVTDPLPYHDYPATKNGPEGCSAMVENPAVRPL